MTIRKAKVKGLPSLFISSHHPPSRPAGSPVALPPMITGGRPGGCRPICLATCSSPSITHSANSQGDLFCP